MSRTGAPFPPPKDRLARCVFLVCFGDFSKPPGLLAWQQMVYSHMDTANRAKVVPRIDWSTPYMSDGQFARRLIELYLGQGE